MFPLEQTVRKILFFVKVYIQWLLLTWDPSWAVALTCAADAPACRRSNTTVAAWSMQTLNLTPSVSYGWESVGSTVAHCLPLRTLLDSCVLVHATARMMSSPGSVCSYRNYAESSFFCSRSSDLEWSFSRATSTPWESAWNFPHTGDSSGFLCIVLLTESLVVNDILHHAF